MLLKSFVQETLKTQYQRCNKDDCDTMMKKMRRLNDIKCNCRTSPHSVTSQAYQRIHHAVSSVHTLWQYM